MRSAEKAHTVCCRGYCFESRSDSGRGLIQSLERNAVVRQWFIELGRWGYRNENKKLMLENSGKVLG